MPRFLVAAGVVDINLAEEMLARGGALGEQIFHFRLQGERGAGSEGLGDDLLRDAPGVVVGEFFVEIGEGVRADEEAQPRAGEERLEIVDVQKNGEGGGVGLEQVDGAGVGEEGIFGGGEETKEQPAVARAVEGDGGRDGGLDLSKGQRWSTFL